MRAIRTLIAIAVTLSSGVMAFAQDLYISTGDGILRLDPQGHISTYVGGLTADSPGGIKFDASGNLYSANSGSGSVSRFTPAGIRTDLATGLTGSWGLAMDSGGNLYTTQGFNSIIQVTQTGVINPVLAGMASPNGMTFDQSGLFYAADVHGVYTVPVVGVRNLLAPATNFPGGAGPVALAFNSHSVLFGSDWNAGTVDRIQADGTVSSFASVAGRPEGLAFDSNDNLYVGVWLPGKFQSSVLKIDPTGAQTVIASGLTNVEQLAFGPSSPTDATPEPGACAVFVAFGSVFVLDRIRRARR